MFVLFTLTGKKRQEDTECGYQRVGNDDDIEMMAENRIFLVPTLSTHLHLEHAERLAIPGFMIGKVKSLVDDLVRTFRKALEGGVPIAMGSDSSGGPLIPAGENLIEANFMVRFGMSPLQAIQAATRDAAELLGDLDDTGTIERGKLANLVVLDSDPLVDIERLKQVHLVMKRGEVIVHRDADGTRSSEIYDGSSELAAAQ